jgi:DNA polymerase V
MDTLDKVNHRYGSGTLQLGTANLGAKPRNWMMKHERRTPAYTTRWEDMPVVHT